MITYNNIITLFNNIAVAHKQLKDFGTGESWEVEGHIKPGIIYPLLWVIPISSQTTSNTQERTFTLLVMGQVKKDKSDEQEILSDCELILNDVIKIFRNESDNYDLIGEPILFPFKEDFGDWITGWRADVQIQTDLNNNYCDIPKLSFQSPNNL